MRLTLMMIMIKFRWGHNASWPGVGVKQWAGWCCLAVRLVMTARPIRAQRCPRDLHPPIRIGSEEWAFAGCAECARLAQIHICRIEILLKISWSWWPIKHMKRNIKSGHYLIDIYRFYWLARVELVSCWCCKKHKWSNDDTALALVDLLRKKTSFGSYWGMIKKLYQTHPPMG